MSGGTPTVLVTGATGFVGRRVVEHFSRLGMTVVAGSRTAPAQAATFPEGVRAVPLDITAPASIGAALEGVDLVIHTAAKTGDWGSRREFLRVLRDGTQNLVEACRGRTLTRFVHLSSVAFYGSTGRGLMTEGMLPGRADDPYAEGKILAEEIVKRGRVDHKLPAVILRPANIFGPGSELWTERPARAIQRGLMSLPSDRGKANPVHVDNVVAAISAVCNDDRAVGEIFNVVDDDELDWAAFFGTYAEALGKGPLVLRPPWALYSLASTLEAVGVVTRQPPLLTRSAVSYLRFGGIYGRGKLEHRVGYSPALSLADALRSTAEYVKERYG